MTSAFSRPCTLIFAIVTTVAAAAVISIVSAPTLQHSAAIAVPAVASPSVVPDGPPWG
jgi:hypothetical protein